MNTSRNLFCNIFTCFGGDATTMALVCSRSHKAHNIGDDDTSVHEKWHDNQCKKPHTISHDVCRLECRVRNCRFAICRMNGVGWEKGPRGIEHRKRMRFVTLPARPCSTVAQATHIFIVASFALPVHLAWRLVQNDTARYTVSVVCTETFEAKKYSNNKLYDLPTTAAAAAVAALSLIRSRWQI